MVVVELATCINLTIELIKFLADNYDAFKHAKKRTQALKITMDVVKETLDRAKVTIDMLKHRASEQDTERLKPACDMLQVSLKDTYELMKKAAKMKAAEWLLVFGGKVRDAMVVQTNTLIERDRFLAGALNNFIEVVKKKSPDARDIPAVLQLSDASQLESKIQQDVQDVKDDLDENMVSEVQRKNAENLARVLQAIMRKKQMLADLSRLRIMAFPFLMDTLEDYSEACVGLGKTDPAIKQAVKALSGEAEPKLKKVKLSMSAGQTAKVQTLLSPGSPKVLTKTLLNTMDSRRKKLEYLKGIEDDFLGRLELMTPIIVDVRAIMATELDSMSFKVEMNDVKEGLVFIEALTADLKDVTVKRQALIDYQGDIKEDVLMASPEDAEKLEKKAKSISSRKRQCNEFVSSLSHAIQGLMLELTAQTVEEIARNAASDIVSENGGNEHEVQDVATRMTALLETANAVHALIEIAKEQNSKQHETQDNQEEEEEEEDTE